MSRRRLLFPNLPLFWKVLVPFLTLMILVGVLGVFLVTSELSAREEASIDQELARRSLDVQAALRDRELYLLESANFAANVEGMASAVAAGNEAAIGRLLQSVLALKPDLDLAVATDRAGHGLVEFTRAGGTGDTTSFGRGRPWSDELFVATAMANTSGAKAAGFVTVGDRLMLAITAPICTASEQCSAVGVALAGIAASDLTQAAGGGPSVATSDEAPASLGAAIYDDVGARLAGSGDTPTEPDLDGRDVVDAAPVRHTRMVDGTELAVLYSPFRVQGTRVGTLAVSVPTESALEAVSGTATRLVVLVLVAMAAIVAIGAVLSRSILAQVRPLVDASRALGQGELGARVPVVGDDELGELARGVNKMAEQLEASYETLELRVEERTEEVRRLLSDRTEFFAGISHELRTPLAVILTQAEMLLAGTAGQQDRRDASETIRASATELLGLVNDILELARAEIGSIELDLEPVDLGQLLGDVRPMLVRLAAASDVEVVVQVPSERLVVEADPSRLRMVLVNLVDNAIKYTPAGGRIVLAVASGAGEVAMSVADTGVGIPDDVGDRVFEPFYRVPGTRPQRDQASSGLGLALTKRWVEAQHGRIRWWPNPGGGTVFQFTVPVGSASSDKRSLRALDGGRRRRGRARAC